MAEKGFWESPWVALSSVLRKRKARAGSGVGVLALVQPGSGYHLTPLWSGDNSWLCAGWQPLP